MHSLSLPSLSLPSFASASDPQPPQIGGSGIVGGPSLAEQLSSPFYGYLPTEWTSVFFATSFLIAAVIHLMQAGTYRKWWLFPTAVLGCCGEVLGWACRVWSSHRPFELTPYLIQTIVLVVSPTFLIGALFITFGNMCEHLGQQYSRLSPRLYAKIFFTSDIAALLIQSVGGGISASSRNANVVQLGGHVILAGVCFQLASLTVFSALVAEYLMRCFKDQPREPAASSDSMSDTATILEPSERRVLRATMPLIFGVCLETALLYIRAVYRTAELAEGWDGDVARTQPLFIVFDGATVLLATLIFNIYHPGRLLKEGPTPKDEDPGAQGMA